MNRKRKLPDSSRESDDEKPCREWLSKLLKEENFFEKQCQQHFYKTMEFFCLDCCIPFCLSCNHVLHKNMKIYQYCTRNSVIVKDFDEFFDCVGVKEYKQGNNNLVHITSTKVACNVEVSHNYMNQCRNLNCRRNLRGDLYCSLGCKVEHCKSSLKDLIKYWGRNRGETVETSAANQNAISNEDSGSHTDAPNSNATLDEVSGSGTTAPKPNVTSNEASGSGTLKLDMNKTPSPDED